MTTVEGAVVLTAITLTTGLMVSGLATVASMGTARSLARDAARAAALGQDPVRAVEGRNPGARVEVTRQAGRAGLEEVSVSVTLPQDAPSTLLPVTAQAVILAEPAEEG